MLQENQKQSIKELRAWAKQNGYVMRKCNVLLSGSKAFKLYDKVSDKAVSSYFTLNDVTMINNNSDVGFISLLHYNHIE